MPTYAELYQEQVWRDEFEAPRHAILNARLRAAWGHTKSETGSKGDNNHLKGRHRSRNWDLESIYCTNRTYATTDQRDKLGNGNWLRATDCGITGTALQAASKRLDTAVRAGQLPCIAEWFGTFNGRAVVGWFQGHESSSDESHLYHLHVGIWTRSCDDSEQMTLLGNVLIGESMSTAEVWQTDGLVPAPTTRLDQENKFWTPAAVLHDADDFARAAAKRGDDLADRLAAIEAKLDLLLAQGGTGGVTLAQVEELLNRTGLAVRPAGPGSGS